MEKTLPPSRANVMRYAAGLTAATILIVVFWPGLMATLFDSGTFMPHSFCYLSNAKLVWLHGVTDFLIGLSYVVISGLLTLLVHRARRDIPFSWVFLAFGLFIVACGMTHVMAIWNLWNADYWFSGGVKQQGTWWTHWAEWALARSGDERPAPKALGSKRNPALEAAPGRYVREQ